MKIIKSKTIRLFLLQIGLLLIILTICRLIFYFFNKTYYPHHSIESALYFFLLGIWFDLITVIYFNIPYFLMYTILSSSSKLRPSILSKAATFIFAFINSLIILSNIADIGYFPFIFQRSSYQTLLSVPDSIPVIGYFTIRFWYFSLTAIIILFILVKCNQKIRNRLRPGKNVVVSTGRLIMENIIFSALLFTACRGIGSFPITPSSAILYVKPPFTSIVNNSAFNILFTSVRYSGGQFEVPRGVKIDRSYSGTVLRTADSTAIFQKKNIVIFVLESFSRSYLEAGHPYKAKTPFLDSIIKKSTVCTNAFANGTMSIHGLNSIIGSIPPIAYHTIINSPYQDNIPGGIGTWLERTGYSTHFFFGSNEDHYGFKRLVRLFGIDNYYSENKISNPDMNDGIWGIYDMPFLEYIASSLKKEKGPFLSIIFNLSSHFPYKIPEPYASMLPKGPLNSSQSISYVDKSIESFFKKIATEPWFENTLFVFIGDHWSHEDNSLPETGINRYKIPFFIYTPDESIKPKKIEFVTDQLSVVPSIMDILHYPYPYITFGNSIFDSTTSHRISYSMLEYPNILQATNDSLTLQFNIQNFSSEGLFRYKVDTSLSENLINNSKYLPAKQAMENNLKSFLNKYYSFLRKE